MNIELHLSKDDLKQIIFKYLNDSDYDVNKDDIIFNVRKDIIGYGPGEHEVAVFDGVSVKCTSSIW